MNDKYLNYKLNKAKDKIYNKFNRLSNFSLEDIIDLLNDYGNTFETTLENAKMFLPTKGNDFTSIQTFTKGFILSEEFSHILVTVFDKHFEVFVLEFKNNKLINYFSLNINEQVLEILYLLEVIKYLDK